ncbi:ATP-dependent RNA helicase DBP5 [Hondaea fermentalgiana]|uniref:RNA helicase n=1 Tax=Hondaea fermentalgiana TaxID=2315210 RepID=A0A2R5GN88_9STRA|nr:ATP-dependent RNA helicase DBP5 [Hondaea fermentalgiana]|eukprot:GBG32350.1 ATP-dependent RNA helicase DBP5 [Hondaea fermentalgiana]
MAEENASAGASAAVEAPAAPAATQEPELKSASWADEVEEGGDGVDALSASAAKLDLDVKGAPDLQSGALIVREAGCAVDEPKTQPVTSFSALNIDDDLKKAIANVKGWSTMSKIQQIGLPLVLQDPPRNLIGQAQAGTGKTGTFVISMLARITAEKKPSTPQAIILAVTQELCTQIAQEVNALGSVKGIKARRVMSARTKTAPIAEGSAAAPWKLEDGEDFDEQVVVGTPGMVKNYLKNASGRKKRKPMIDASECRVLILDEADKMVQLPPHGFGQDVQEIRDAILKKRKDKPCQILLFSATFTENVRQIARQFVGGHDNDESKYHEITLRKKDVTLDKVVNFFVYIGDENDRNEEEMYQKKFEAITDIWANLSQLSEGQSVIFCNRKDRVQRLADYLRGENFQVGQIHGDMDKRERDVVLAEFKRGERKALVSTDVTSRGIDNPNVTLVINVDLPINREREADPENFVHRIGRSGRWTKKGASVSLVARSPAFKDLGLMKDIERSLFANADVNRPLIPVDDISHIEEKIISALESSA